MKKSLEKVAQDATLFLFIAIFDVENKLYISDRKSNEKNL